MNLHELALIIIAFFSELLGTISGFGSSTFFVPTAQFFESFQLVLAITALLHCFGNLSRIYLFRKHFSWNLLVMLAVPSIIFTALGAYLTAKISSDFLQRSLGVVLVLISLVFLYKHFPIRKIPKSLAIVLSALSGFLTGLVGTGGAIRGLALTLMQIEKNSFVILSAAIDIGGDITRATIYIINGYMNWEHWFYLPLLGISAWAGVILGKKILAKFDQKQFEKIVAFFVLISGLAMVFR
jgi:uncharacterized membrane protein YfcA